MPRPRDPHRDSSDPDRDADQPPRRSSSDRGEGAEQTATTGAAPRPGDLRIGSERRGDSTVLALSGEIDLATVPDLEVALQTAERRRPQRLVLDFAQVRFMDSSGIRTLLLAQRRATLGEHRLILRRCSPPVRRLLEITGIVDQFFFDGD